MVAVTDPALLRSMTAALRGLGAALTVNSTSKSAAHKTWTELSRLGHHESYEERGAVIVFIRRMG